MSVLGKEFSINVSPILDFYTASPSIPKIAVSDIIDNKFRVFGKPTMFYWHVFAKRENIDVEINKSNTTINGRGPYKWIGNN